MAYHIYKNPVDWYHFPPTNRQDNAKRCKDATMPPKKGASTVFALLFFAHKCHPFLHVVSSASLSNRIDLSWKASLHSHRDTWNNKIRQFLNREEMNPTAFIPIFYITKNDRDTENIEEKKKGAQNRTGRFLRAIVPARDLQCNQIIRKWEMWEG